VRKRTRSGSTEPFMTGLATVVCDGIVCAHIKLCSVSTSGTTSRRLGTVTFTCNAASGSSMS
jgi:hypothetical protein